MFLSSPLSSNFSLCHSYNEERSPSALSFDSVQRVQPARRRVAVVGPPPHGQGLEDEPEQTRYTLAVVARPQHSTGRTRHEKICPMWISRSRLLFRTWKSNLSYFCFLKSCLFSSHLTSPHLISPYIVISMFSSSVSIQSYNLPSRYCSYPPFQSRAITDYKTWRKILRWTQRWRGSWT